VATKRVEEIYEEFIEALPAADLLWLVELIQHGIVALIDGDLLPSRSLLGSGAASADVAEHQCPGIAG
jgi:hypothetical protein